MTPRIWLGAGVLVLTGTLAIQVQVGASQEGTVQAGIYSTEQAERGKAIFDKICASCHTFQPSAKSKDNPDLGGEVFLTKWDKKSVHEIATVIYTSMPNDGSAMVSEAETADLIAFILQQNKFPAGAQPFKWDASARKILIVK